MDSVFFSFTFAVLKMYSVSKTVQDITESATLEMTKLSRELLEQGKDIISLSIGEPDFNTPIPICNAAAKAALDGFTHYPPVLGLLNFRQAIVQKLKNDNGLTYAVNEVIVSNGAKHSIINAVLAVINKGDEVLIPAPFWVSYPSMVEYAGGVVVPVSSTIENNYKPTAAQIEACITDKTKLFVFSNPTNPSGSVWSKQELTAIANVLAKYPKILVISDEIYEKINFTNSYTSFASLPGMQERTATVNGLAKGFAMTGWRIGYLAAPTWWVAACEKVQGLFTSGANSVAQMAGIEALLHSEKAVNEFNIEFKRRRDFVYSTLKTIPNLKVNLPDGAFYFFPDVSAYFGKSYDNFTVNTASDLSMFLLKYGLIATVGGDAFGAPNAIRLSYALDPTKLATACDRLKTALALLT